MSCNKHVPTALIVTLFLFVCVGTSDAYSLGARNNAPRSMRVTGVVKASALPSSSRRGAMGIPGSGLLGGRRKTSRTSFSTVTLAADSNNGVSTGKPAEGESLGDTSSYLLNITGTDEERDAKRNKDKLRQSVNEVKNAARVVKEKSKKLSETTTGGEVAVALSEVTESAGKLGETVIKKSPSLLARTLMLFVSKEMRSDIKRRREHYWSDWTDAFTNKRQTIPAILFLYFACLSPAISFGTISSQLTNGSIGVVEFLLSSGCSGMAYAILCGQPMAFIAPTGLTLAFISGLFRFCTLKGVPFFPVYTWVGLWTSFFMVSLGMAGSSRLIQYCTRFTDEVFNGLLSLNFIYEAASSLRRNFVSAPDPMNLTMPFMALSMALTTLFSTMKVIAFQTSKYFNQRVRTIVKDFGPVAIIVFASLINQFPIIHRYNVPTLSVAKTFELAGGRDFLIPLRSIPVAARLLCAFPAVLLTSLFFMDQNISVRVVNNPDNKLQKGPAYNLDMVALGIVTGVLSLVGLPWMCGATVQSMNHMKAMTTTKFNEETETVEIEKVTETRVTGFVIHALIAATVKALPLLRYLPIPVVSGVFLFLGRKLMTGNSFIERIGDGFAEKKRLPKDHPIHVLGRKKMNMFTTLQIACLAGLWTFKQNPATAIFFPSVIGMLVAIRSFVLPRFFTETELVALGDPTPGRSDR